VRAAHRPRAGVRPGAYSSEAQKRMRATAASGRHPHTGTSGGTSASA
jgi:hypothetical protein